MLDNDDGDDDGEDECHGDADNSDDAAKTEHILFVLLILE